MRKEMTMTMTSNASKNDSMRNDDGLKSPFSGEVVGSRFSDDVVMSHESHDVTDNKVKTPVTNKQSGVNNTNNDKNTDNGSNNHDVHENGSGNNSNTRDTTDTTENNNIYDNIAIAKDIIYSIMATQATQDSSRLPFGFLEKFAFVNDLQL